MTDQQTYTDTQDDTRLRILDLGAGDLSVRTMTPSGSGTTVEIPAAVLLAMIDRLGSDALRAYLRERSDLIDAPDESCATLEDMLPADLAAEAARYRIDAVPEADSPEDVDERPAPATTERLALLEQIRDLYPNLPPSRHIGVVHWLLEGTVLIERVERLLDRPAR